MARRLLLRALTFLAVCLLIFVQVSARSVPHTRAESLVDSADWLHHSKSSNISLHPRADDKPPPLTWDKAVQNGKGHMCNCERLETPPHPKTGEPKPVWTGDDLDMYWTPQDYYIGDARETETTISLRNAFSALKLSTTFPPNKGFVLYQDSDWTGKDGKRYLVPFPFTDSYHAEDH